MTQFRQFLSKHGRRLSNFLFYGMIVGLVLLRAPTWLQQYQLQGLPSPQVTVLAADRTMVNLPPQSGKPSILIFWATWCRPCTVELRRFAAAVNEGKIDPGQLFAVSLQEEPDTVFSVAKERGYPFAVYADPSGKSGQYYKVSGTPTVAHLSAAGEIQWISSGLSPLGIWRAERHLKAPTN